MSAGLLQLSGVVVDVWQKMARAPGPGEGATASAARVSAGGGFNALAAARRAGAAAAYGGALGTGPFADLCAAALDAEGAPALQRRRMAADQGFCTVWVEADGERRYVYAPGAEREAAGDDLAALPAGDFAWALVSGYAAPPEGPDVFGDWLAALPRPVLLMFDPTPLALALGPGPMARALARADWISANAAEARALTGHGPAQAAQALAQGRRGAVVRDGPRGCFVATGGQAVDAPGFPVAPVDTAGAGDAHVGAFIAAMLQGAGAAEAARFANAAAAIAVTRPGAASAPARAEIEAWLAARHAG